MKKLFLFLLISHKIFSEIGAEHNTMAEPNNRTETAQENYNEKTKEIKDEYETSKKAVTAKYQAQTNLTNPKDTTSTASSQAADTKQASTFDLENFGKKINDLTAQRQAEDEARQKLWQSEDKAAAAVRDKQDLAERMFFASSADTGTDTEEQLARNKQIVDTNRTRVFEDLTMKAEHFKALETAHSEFFSNNESWKTLLKLGDTQSFINDPVEKRTEFLEKLKTILENKETFNITDQEGKNALRDLLKLTQLHTTGSAELDPDIENLLQSEANEDNQKELSNELKKFLKETMQAGLEKLQTFSENIEKIKAELVTKLAAVQKVKDASNTMTVALGAAAVLGLSNGVDTMYEHIKMSMETFAIGAKTAFVGAHLSEHSETSLIRQLQDAFIDTFQPLLPKTTELLKTVEYKNEAESVGSRLNQKFKYKTSAVGSAAKAVGAAVTSGAAKVNDATSFESTKLTKDLLKNPNPNNIDKEVQKIVNEVAQENLRSQRLSSIIDLINKDPQNPAATKIIEKLTSYGYLDDYEKASTGKWEKKATGLFSKFTKFVKEESSQVFNRLLSSKNAQNDIFEEYKLQTNDPKLSDAQLKIKMDKELKQIEIIKAKKELEAYKKYKEQSGTSSNSLDLEEFKKADALLTLEQEMADLVRKEEWTTKDKNYAKIRDERSWAEKFIKMFTTDSASDHERTNTRNQVILETNIERMSKDFEVKKQRFDSFKQKYSEFSDKAPWKNLLEMNDTQNFITMTYEQRTNMLNQVDSAIQEFLKSEEDLNNKDMSAIQDFVKLNNYYLNNNEKLSDNINTLLTSEASQADPTQLSNALKDFFKTTIQSSIQMMHVFNENMKDIQGSVTTLEGLKKVKDCAYGSLMVSSLVGTAAFFARLHGLVEPMAAIAKISLGVAHVYTEKEAHLAQTIQDTYKDTFSKLLPKSTKLIATTVHVNMGKSAIEFESTSLTKELMTMDTTNPEFKNTLEKLRIEISTRSYSETYRVKRIESLLDIVNANPESPAAKEIVDLFKKGTMKNDKKILEDHVIEQDNGKWIIRSKKSASLDLVNKLMTASTHDYSKLLKQIKESLQDELSGLSPQEKTAKIKSVLDVINKNKKDGAVSDMELQKIYPDLFEFLNTATTKPSLTTKAKRAISNFFNRTESKPEKLILENDAITKDKNGNWIIKRTISGETLDNLMKTNIQDNKFEENLKDLTTRLKSLDNKLVSTKKDPQILLDRVDSLLDIINETPNSSAAQEIVKNINDEVLQDKNYSLEQENGKWKMVSQESINIANKILTSKIVDLKTKSELIQELSRLSPELRNKQIKKILEVLNNSENVANSSIIVNLLNSTVEEPKDIINKAKNLFSKTSLLGDYSIAKDENGKYILEAKPEYQKVINNILDRIVLNSITLENINQKFLSLPQDLLDDTMKKFLKKINNPKKDSFDKSNIRISNDLNADLVIRSLNLNALEKSPYTIVKINNEYVLQPKKSSDLSLVKNGTQPSPTPAAKSN